MMRERNYQTHCRCTPSSRLSGQETTPYTKLTSNYRDRDKLSPSLWPCAAQLFRAMRVVNSETREGCICVLGGVASWANQVRAQQRCQIFQLRKIAAGVLLGRGEGNSSASSPSTPIRGRRLTKFDASRKSDTASAPFTTGSPAAPRPRSLSASRSWAKSFRIEFPSQAKQPEASARSAVTTSGRLAMGWSRPVTGRSVTATSERMDATGGESAATNCIGVVTSGEAAKRLINVDLRSRVWVGPSVTRTSSPLRCNSSSGGGLGIQQPGSMTWGDRYAMPAPSGRARDRAICPAAARSLITGFRSIT
jgi:hypothetical protein